ncbi:MAG: hypothetical protein FJX53_04350 [Alphaproteobacteria bacterium]|nr:hypothetical protein [Alphaproteobacteria bacterium]
MDRFVAALDPVMTAYAVAVVGMIAIAASEFIGVGRFTAIVLCAACDGGVVEKQVGYIYAVNWSLAFVLLLPAALRFGLAALQEIGHRFRAMALARMFADAGFRVMDGSEVIAYWHRTVGRLAVFMVVIAAVVTAYIANDFMTVVAGMEAKGPPVRISLDDTALENDWSIAALLQAAPGETLPNATATFWFALIVYVLLAVSGSIYGFIFFSFAFGLTSIVNRLSRSDVRPLLLPDLGAEDLRGDSSGWAGCTAAPSSSPSCCTWSCT